MTYAKVLVIFRSLHQKFNLRAVYLLGGNSPLLSSFGVVTVGEALMLCQKYLAYPQDVVIDAYMYVYVCVCIHMRLLMARRQ